MTVGGLRSLDVLLTSPERNSIHAAQSSSSRSQSHPARVSAWHTAWVRINQYPLFKYSNPKKIRSHKLKEAERRCIQETLHFTYFTFYLNFSKAARKKPLVSSSLPGSKRCTSLHSSSDSPHPGLPSPPTLIERECVCRRREDDR
jgi:hypothetical protein